MKRREVGVPVIVWAVLVLGCGRQLGVVEVI